LVCERIWGSVAGRERNREGGKTNAAHDFVIRVHLAAELCRRVRERVESVECA